MGDMTHYPYLPFAPEPQVAVFGDQLWVTSGAAPEVEAYDPSGNVVARVRWDVVDPDKGWVATVETPPGFTVFQVDGESILGLHQDEEGVQRVQVYTLSR